MLHLLLRKKQEEISDACWVIPAYEQLRLVHEHAAKQLSVCLLVCEDFGPVGLQRTNRERLQAGGRIYEHENRSKYQGRKDRHFAKHYYFVHHVVKLIKCITCEEDVCIVV